MLALRYVYMAILASALRVHPHIVSSLLNGYLINTRYEV